MKIKTNKFVKICMNGQEENFWKITRKNYPINSVNCTSLIDSRGKVLTDETDCILKQLMLANQDAF